MQEFSLPLRVYIEDTDAGGIVYYVNYLKFMERSRTELLRTLGYDKPAILDDQLLLVVHSANVVYKRSAKLDDQLQITTKVAKLARSYVVFQQRVFRNNDELLCEGEIKVACVSQQEMRPQAMPKQLFDAIQQWAR